MFGVDVQLLIKTVITFAGTMVDNLKPTVIYMFYTLVTIDLVLSMLFDESDGLNIFMKLVKKLFYYLFFYYIIINYKDLIFNTLFNGFVQLGNLAATGTTSTELNWTAINKIGMSVGKMAGAVATGLGFVAIDFAGIESASIIGLFAVASYVLFFVFLYVQIITVFIKFYFMAGFAFVLMPFAGYEKTKDIASKGLNGLFTHAIEIFVMVVMIDFVNYLDGINFFDVTGSIKSTIWTRWVLTILMYLLLTKTGTIASSMMSGAIAALGIGASAMSSAHSSLAGSPRGALNASNQTMDKVGPGFKNKLRSGYASATNFINRFRGKV